MRTVLLLSPNQTSHHPFRAVRNREGMETRCRFAKVEVTGQDGRDLPGSSLNSARPAFEKTQFTHSSTDAAFCVDDGIHSKLATAFCARTPDRGRKKGILYRGVNVNDIRLRRITLRYFLGFRLDSSVLAWHFNSINKSSGSQEMTLLVLEGARGVMIICCFLSFRVTLFSACWWQHVSVAGAGFGVFSFLNCRVWPVTRHSPSVFLRRYCGSRALLWNTRVEPHLGRAVLCSPGDSRQNL